MKRKLILNNPVAEIEFQATTNPIVRYLSPDEEDRLLKALIDREDRKRAKRASANRWATERGYNLRPEFPVGQFVDYLRPMALTALHTGLRRGELFSLKWKHVKLQKGKTTEEISYIRVPGSRTKNRKPHEVPLNDFVTKVLRVWSKRRAPFDTDTYVFPGKKGNKLNDIGRAWSAVLESAGIKNFRWHDLRHDFASKLVMAGQPLNTVRELMNHADLQMTLRYAHLAPDHKRDSVNSLSRDKGKWTI